MRYWIIAPYDSQRQAIFDKAWSYDVRNGTIAMGWSEVGDISSLTQAELREACQRAFPTDREASQKYVCNTLWRFFHEVLPGDKVMARRGRKVIAGIGTVTGPAFYDESKGIERVGLDKLPAMRDASGHWDGHWDSPNFVPVEWESTTEVDLGTIVFSMFTMYEVSEEKFSSLSQGSTAQIEEQPEVASPDAVGEFALEKHLEDFMAKNFDRIFNGQLALYQDAEGVVGQQYPIVDEDGRETGAIDLLAVDKGTSDFVVIELKKGRESDKVIGQILRYIGWIQENLCDHGQKVKGIVICSEHDDRLRYAVKPVSNFVQVKRYRVDFQLLDS